MLPASLSKGTVPRGPGVPWLAGTVILVALSSIPPAARADGPDDVAGYELGEIIVTAKRPRVVEAVSTLDEITADDIRRSGARNLADALMLMSGLYLRQGADGVPRVDVRGLRTRNILLLVDGVPANSTFDGQFDPAAIQVENIARIKFTRGGSSVLYGPGGNAGIINIITRSATDDPSGGLLLEGGSEATWEARAWFAARTDKLAWSASGSAGAVDSWELSDDYEPTDLQPAGERINSDREDQALHSNLTYDFSDATSAGLSIAHNQGAYGKPPITVAAGDSPFARRARYERVDYDGWTSQFVARHAFSDTVSIRPALFYNTRDELTDGFDDATYSTQAAARAFHEDATTTIRGGNLQLTVDTASRGLFTLSAAGREERWDTTGFVLESSGGGGGGGGGGGSSAVETLLDDDRDVFLYSLAGEWETRLTDGLSAVVGASWNRQQRDDSDNEDEWAYLAGVRFALTDTTRMRSSYARQIRFPTLRDLYAVDRGNPALVPEKTDNVELGLEQDLLDGRGTVEIVLYRVDANDFIERGLSGLAENFEVLRFQGFELNGRYVPGEHLEFRFGYTFLDAENRGENAATSAVQNRPEHKLSLRMDYDVSGATSLYAAYLFVADALVLSRNAPVETMRLGDYHVVDAGISRSLLGERLRLVGRIENLFDENYQESFGFPRPGRRFYLGVEVRL